MTELTEVLRRVDSRTGDALARALRAKRAFDLVLGIPLCLAAVPVVLLAAALAVQHGLTDVLVGDATLANALRRCDANILILPAGTPRPTRPSCCRATRPPPSSRRSPRSSTWC